MSSIRRLTEIVFVETAGWPRVAEPVTFGCAAPRGRLRDVSALVLLNADGTRRPLQVKATAMWADGSVRWMLCDTQVDAPANGRSTLVLAEADDAATTEAHGLRVTEGEAAIVVSTGTGEYQVPRRGTFALARLHPNLGSRVSITLADGRPGTCQIESTAVETAGHVRVVIQSEGAVASPDGPTGLRFVARQTFRRGSPDCRLELTLHNPNAAVHPGSLWDLGDPHAVRLVDCSVVFDSTSPLTVHWQLAPGQGVAATSSGEAGLFQGSSGGPNERSTNHVNAAGQVPVVPGGCQVLLGEDARTMPRATPTVVIADQVATLSVTVEKFWQNFPKALTASTASLAVGLFPSQYGDPFELQPGEKKRHVIHVTVDGPGVDPVRMAERLNWIHEPLVAVVPGTWWAECEVFPNFAVWTGQEKQDYREIVEAAIEGPHSFVAKRETIDEYGWRNFGDVYADHESAFNADGQPYVSHYNNQYDLLQSALLHFCRTGDIRWRRFADELAAHVRDIDIYQTRADRYEFNGGLFWHTNHYLDAGTATHRCYSRTHLSRVSVAGYGGGPSPAHCYPGGLVAHYYLSGDPDSRAGALAQIDLARALIAGAPTARERAKALARRTIKGALALARGSRLPNELAWPGRAGANVLNALLDGYLLGGQERDLRLVERLIRRSVSPADDPNAMELADAEHKWSYLIFLQAMGRFLGISADLPAFADLRAYVSRVILHYADWMCQFEKPFLSQPEKLEFPTETWATIELRKTNVLLQAAVLTDGERRRRYLDKAHYYYERTFSDLAPFGDKAHFARPVAILMANACMYDRFRPIIESEMLQAAGAVRET